MTQNSHSTANIKEITELEQLYSKDYKSFLLIGESDTSKTLSLSFFILHLIKEKNFKPEEITILDFGPPKFQRAGIFIGGRVSDYLDILAKKYPELQRVKYIMKEERFRAPRSDAKNTQHVLNLCFKNWQKAREHLKIYEKEQTPVLIINDLSIYLHMGSLTQIKRIKEKATVFFANAYSGKRLIMDMGSNISSAEIRLLKKFSESVEVTYKTTPKFNESVVKKFKEIISA
jgi:glutaredoxin